MCRLQTFPATAVCLFSMITQVILSGVAACVSARLHLTLHELDVQVNVQQAPMYGLVLPFSYS